MKALLILLLCIVSSGLNAQDYPELKYKSATVDTFFGVPVADPYRWLESMHSDSVANWLHAQMDITANEKKKFGANYRSFYNDLNDERYKYFNEYKDGPYYFSRVFYEGFRTELFFRTTLLGEDAVAFNPEIYPAYKNYNMGGASVSADGNYLAVALSKAGSDWMEIRVKRIYQDALLDDKIEWVKFSSICWWRNGFFYSRFAIPPVEGVHTAANTGQQICYHVLGTSQKSDPIVYTALDKINMFTGFGVTSNNRFLLIDSKTDTSQLKSNIVQYIDLEKGLTSGFKTLVSVNGGKQHIFYSVFDYINGHFMAITNAGAPNNRVVLLNKDSLNSVTKFIPEGRIELTSVHNFGGRLLCVYKSIDSSYAIVYNYDGKPWRKLKFNPGTSINGFNAMPEDSEAVFWESSYYSPPAAYVFNIHQGKVAYSDQAAIKAAGYSGFTTSVVRYKSKDGTEIAMYLTYRKGLNLKGNNPVLLYGYGGYGIAMRPSYNPIARLFCSYGGIYAVALIRGGGEEGESWHLQGSGLKKQNSFDDFIAAAEFLISNGYTTKEKLAIEGGSNGGLLVGAVLTQRPDLFKAAVAYVGVYDMLRYQKFTSGRFSINEFGVSTDSVQFHNLIRYSPLHNVKEGVNYPATLLFTAENDDRVPPFHTYKFLAALQQKSAGNEPHILYFEEAAGHNGPHDIEQASAERAFELAFIFERLKLKRKAVN